MQLRNNLTELESLELESKLIDIFGLMPHAGYLTNLDEGMLPDERRCCYPAAFQCLRKINHLLDR